MDGLTPLSNAGRIVLVLACLVLYALFMAALFELVGWLVRRFRWWLRSPRFCHGPACGRRIDWPRARAAGLEVNTCSDTCFLELGHQKLIAAHPTAADLGTGYRRHLPALIERQRGFCGICGEALPLYWSEIHVDHITPQCRGGTDELDNLQAAHASCNIRKGPCTMDELSGDLFRTPTKPRSI